MLGGLRDVWKRGRLTREVKKKMFEGCCVPVVMYGSEGWQLNARKRKKVEVFEMKGLRAVCRGGWLSGFKELLRDRGLRWEEGLRLTEDRNEWKRLVKG